jgi:hypothetical protein
VSVALDLDTLEKAERISDDKEKIRPGFCQNHPYVRAMTDGSGLCYGCNR